MNFDFWKKTKTLKTFTIEEWDQFTEDSCKLPKLTPFQNSPLKKSTIKKGIAGGDRFDSFSEFTLKTYFTKIKGYVVERNTTLKLPYSDDKGKQRHYIPDFIVNGILHEVKGRVNPLDLIKKEAYPDVVWVFQDEINEMASQLDKEIPGWRDEFIQT